MIGGILSSTALTLLVVPGLYRMFHGADRSSVSADAAVATAGPLPSEP